VVMSSSLRHTFLETFVDERRFMGNRNRVGAVKT